MYGAVTVGNIWLVGWLDVKTQQIYKYIAIYRVPADLQDVMEILMGVLTLDQLATA